MPLRRTAALLLLTVLVLHSATAQPTADPADVASPEAVVEAAYAALQRAPGEPFDWPRFRSLFLPDAVMIPNTEQTGGAFTTFTPETFIAWVDERTVVGGPDDKGFAEEAIYNVVQRYGDVAHAMSSYQKHFWDDPRILGRGVNSFTMVQHDGRWWIASVAWDEENGAGPIPPAFLPGQ